MLLVKYLFTPCRICALNIYQLLLMAAIHVLNIQVLNPNAKFKEDFQFEIVFECLSELKKEIEWKVVYIGNADNEQYDQELESIEIGPLKLGTMKFTLNAPCPDYMKIPENEVLGVTAILLCCLYSGQEFFRCGFYLNNVYDNEEMNANPPEQIVIDKVIRSILADKPRITKFNIDWNCYDTCMNAITTINNTHNTLSNSDYMFQGGKMDVDQFNALSNQLQQK